MNVVVLVSGGGTNLQALIDYEKSASDCPYKIVAVCSNTKNAFALERAQKAGIPAFVKSPFS
ncbi:MAG: phosphoribosylglycinamide formyltransferase, partial [Treponemataceae bacterium]|nr:phosphoribosylglycinamide formyltransferase [Treponemataceae bacterium]